MALNKETTEQLIESLQDAMFSTSIKNAGGQSIRERVQNIINQNVGGSVLQETVEISNGELVINPNEDKLIDPITQPAGQPIEIKYGIDREDNTTQQFLYTTAGDGNATTFSKDFKAGNKENDTIDVNSVNTYLITLFYWDEKTKFVFITKGTVRENSAPSATFTPSDGGTLSAIDGDIKIDFNKAIRSTDLKQFVTSNPKDYQKLVSSVVELTKNGGNAVTTSPSINAAENQITLNQSGLQDGDSLELKLFDHEDYSGNEVGSTQSISFTVSVASTDKEYVLGGSNENLKFPDVAELDLEWDSGFSLEWWGKWTSNVGNFGGLMSKESTGKVGYGIIKNSSENITFNLKSGDANIDRWETDGTFSTDTFYHIICTSQGDIYINGSTVAVTKTSDTLSGNSILNNVALRVMAGRDDLASVMAGTVRLDRVWNKILTSAEVTDLYNSGNPKGADLTSIDGSDISANAVQNHIVNNDSWDSQNNQHILEEETNNNDGVSENMEEGDLQES